MSPEKKYKCVECGKTLPREDMAIPTICRECYMRIKERVERNLRWLTG